MARKKHTPVVAPKGKRRIDHAEGELLKADLERVRTAFLAALTDGCELSEAVTLAQALVKLSADFIHAWRRDPAPPPVG